VTFNETGKKYAQHPCEDFHDLAYCKKIEKYVQRSGLQFFYYMNGNFRMSSTPRALFYGIYDVFSGATPTKTTYNLCTVRYRYLSVQGLVV